MGNWWYAKNGDRRGPIAEEQLRNLVGNGEVASADLVWTQGMAQWQPASTVGQLRAVGTAAPAEPARVIPVAQPVSSRVVAGSGADCPHCNAVNPMLAAYCETCGKAMPGPLPKEPRILKAEEIPTSSAAGKLVGDELTKVTKSAATMLLIVSILQIVVGGLVTAAVVMVPRRPGTPPPNIAILAATTIGVGVIFLGLYFWARRSPLPATIVGLVIYGTLIVLNVVASIAAMARDSESRGTGIGGIGIGWLDIVIIAILARGISAALKTANS